MAHYIYENGLKLRQKVRAIILNEEGEVLLVRPHGYAPNEWALAGGGVESGESPVAAMRRELAEELGLECDDPEQLPTGNCFIYPEDYKAKRSLDHDSQKAVMFLVRIGSDCRLRVQAEEIADARWFDAADAPDAFPVKKQQAIFRECLSSASRSAAAA